MSSSRKPDSEKSAPLRFPELEFKPFAALRETFRAGYTRDDLRADVMAGLVVGIVALPLAMALAIASGVPPQHGLYTAIVAGGLIALLGGSRTQVSGPTAAFVVLLVPISAKYGLGGLAIASVMAGIILVVLGVGRLGLLLQYVPFPVTTGFTAGIAVVIATLQVKDVLGLTIPTTPEHMSERVRAIVDALPSAQGDEAFIAALTFALLLLWPRVTKKIPAPLIALSIAATVSWVLMHTVSGFEIATIGTRFSTMIDGAKVMGIPRQAPMPVWPWNLPGADGAPIGLSIELLRALLPSAFALAMLGAIESLLSASVADGMAKTKHDPNAELVAQGVGNIVAPFFAGFVATGAIARTATNVRSGARSPIASIVHAVFLLLAVLLFAPLVAHLPMASLSALLVLVAWNMSEVKHFVHTLKVAPRSDVVVLLVCFFLTVAFDMVISVSVGVVLAALLFMRRMAELTGARLVSERHESLELDVPAGVAIYEIAGPLFFGAAQKAMAALDATSTQLRVIIFDLSEVPVMDATGLVAFESALDRLRAQGTLAILVGVRTQPKVTLTRGGVVTREGAIAFAATLKDAIPMASRFIEPPSPPSAM
jgi:SulP family sulfate permease